MHALMFRNSENRPRPRARAVFPICLLGRPANIAASTWTEPTETGAESIGGRTGRGERGQAKTKTIWNPRSRHEHSHGDSKVVRTPLNPPSRAPGTAALLVSSRIGSSRSTVYPPPSAPVTVCTKKGVLVRDGCGSRVKWHSCKLKLKHCAELERWLARRHWVRELALSIAHRHALLYASGSVIGVPRTCSKRSARSSCPILTKELSKLRFLRTYLLLINVFLFFIFFFFLRDILTIRQFSLLIIK